MTAARLLADAPRRVLMALVRFYRYWLSPWLGSSCLYEPTCSAYALQALERHGALAGSYLAAARLARCTPWCDAGCDPVLPRSKFVEELPSALPRWFTPPRAPAQNPPAG